MREEREKSEEGVVSVAPSPPFPVFLTTPPPSLLFPHFIFPHQADEVRERRVRQIERRGRSAGGEHGREDAIGEYGVLRVVPAPAGGVPAGIV